MILAASCWVFNMSIEIRSDRQPCQNSNDFFFIKISFSLLLILYLRLYRQFHCGKVICSEGREKDYRKLRRVRDSSRQIFFFRFFYFILFFFRFSANISLTALPSTPSSNSGSRSSRTRPDPGSPVTKR